MKCKNQMILCALATLLMMLKAVSAGTLAEYSITPSSQLAYYHYPAPTGNQFRETPQRLSPVYKPATQQQQQARPRYAAQPRTQQQYTAASYQPQEQQQQRQVAYQPQEQQQQQVAYQPQPQQQLQQQHVVYQPQQQQQQIAYQHQQQQQQPRTIQQFATPALDHAAFTLALTSQGYELGAPAAAAAIPPAPAAALRSASSTTTELQSVNVKLPLPIGLTPLNNAPLPLQSGASFSSLPHEVTSYGTKHPLKKIR